MENKFVSKCPPEGPGIVGRTDIKANYLGEQKQANVGGITYDVPEGAPWCVIAGNKIGWYSDKDGIPDRLVLELDIKQPQA